MLWRRTTNVSLETELRRLLAEGNLELPFPGRGETALRHRKLASFGRADLGLARLVEAHVDAIAILAEAGAKPHSGLYGVWAAETAGMNLRLNKSVTGITLTGKKMFCTGGGLLDRALVTICEPAHRLVDVSLREFPATICFDFGDWKTPAFADTQTATAHFLETPVSVHDLIGEPHWYLDRPGFWHGACGPAACWAGGAMGLVDYALQHPRKDPHALAHLGAMKADVWALQSYLESAGREIDAHADDRNAAQERALMMRHLIEQACLDILQRLARAYGPRPLAYDEVVLKRYHELELYIRQCHAERDLEVIGRMQS